MSNHSMPDFSIPGEDGLKTFCDRITMLKHIGLRNKCVAEIGVLYGEFSAELLNEQPRDLFLIDPWANQPLHQYIDINAEQDCFNKVRNSVLDRFAKQIGTGQVTVVRSFSHVAAREIDRKNFDVVFIDGNHSYNWVLADLFVWYTKVKEGGWLCFHDYRRSDFLGVEQAVSKFCEMTGYKVSLETTESSWTSGAIQIV